jgi:cytochrome c oxidase subunit 4
LEQSSLKNGAAVYKTYFYTWLALLVLAALTIAVTQFHMGGISILIALFIASVKAALILYYFMRLRYEDWFFKLAFLLPVIVFMFFIGFTFLDVLYR